VGYGAGIRYIVQDELVVRFDAGFSRAFKEVAFIFNYGHTF